MIQNPVESVDALTKLADVIGKKTLVMWAILTTFTTGYLFIRNDKLQDKLLNTQEAGYERLINRIDKVEKTSNYNKEQIDSTLPKLDTTIFEVREKLKEIKRSK